MPSCWSRLLLAVAAVVMASPLAAAAELKQSLAKKHVICSTLEFWFKGDGTVQTIDIIDDDVFWVSQESEVKWQPTQVEITITVLGKSFVLLSTPAGILGQEDICLVH